MKKRTKPLRLTRETVTLLTAEDVSRVVGQECETNGCQTVWRACVSSPQWSVCCC